MKWFLIHFHGNVDDIVGIVGYDTDQPYFGKVNVNGTIFYFDSSPGRIGEKPNAFGFFSSCGDKMFDSLEDFQAALFMEKL